MGYDVDSDEGYVHVNQKGMEAMNVDGGCMEPGSASQDAQGSSMGGSVEGATVDLAPTDKIVPDGTMSIELWCHMSTIYPRIFLRKLLKCLTKKPR